MTVSGASDLVEISGEIRAERPKAILFFDGDKEVWLPRSMIEVEPAGRGTVTITLPMWKAKDEGLI